MARTRTTLATALTATDDICKVTSATGAAAGMLIQIDQEVALIKEVSGSFIKLKRRGTHGSVAKAHQSLAPVQFFLATDAPTPGDRQDLPSVTRHATRDVVTANADGAIALPTRDTVVLITKASAAALTLADPTNVPDGTELVILATTAAAHTVTLTTGYGGSNATDVFTWQAVLGTALRLFAYKGLWAHAGIGLAADESAAAAVA